MMEGCAYSCGINMPEVVRSIAIVLARAIGARESYCTLVRVVWLPFFPVTAESCCVQVLCYAVNSTSLVHRAPTTTLRQSTLMARHVVARGPGEGVCLFFFFFFHI